MHRVECGVLHKQFCLLCLHRVPRRCMCFFFWHMIRAVLSLARCCQLFLNILAGRSAIASLSFGAVQTASSLGLWDTHLARTRLFFSRPCCFCAREYNTLRVTSSSGPCVGGERLLHRSQWSEAQLRSGIPDGSVLVRDNWLGPAWIIAGKCCIVGTVSFTARRFPIRQLLRA